MKVQHGHDSDTDGAVLALGNFDGVHLGHQSLIAAAIACGRPSGVLTFDPHPLAVLQPASTPYPVVSLERRLALLEEAGCDLVVIEPFTPQLAALSSSDFVEQVLVGGLGIRGVVVGENFRYGHGRRGNVSQLVLDGKQLGFEVTVVEPVMLDGAPVSSTRIRAALAAGEVGIAAALLGRGWDVSGVVVHGAKRGRELGFPTANVQTNSGVPLPLGIYAVWFWDGEKRLPGVASYGTNPTFVDGGSVVLEVYVLDFDGDLYGHDVRVEFVAWQRGEVAYTTVDALVTQITADVVVARQLLSR